MKISNVLKKLNACEDAVAWSVQYGSNYKKAWDECERGDWSLWLAKKLNIDDKKLTMVKAMCAKQVEHLMKDQRSKDALQACFDYANGKITREELNAAAYAAYAAADAAAAVYDAAAVAYAAYAAYAAAAAAYTTHYAAVYAAAAYTTAYAAVHAAAKKDSLKKSADICREYLTDEVIEKYKKLR